MAATVRAGSGATGQNTDREIRQVRDNITMIWPEQTPFFAALQRTAKVRDGVANKLEWQHLDEYPRYVTVNGAGASNSATSIPLSSTTQIQESSILQDMDSGEQLLVLSKTSTHATVGTRGNFGGGTPQALTAGRNLYILGNPREEGANALSATGITTSFDYNYFGQHEEVWGSTDRNDAIDQYGNPMGISFEEANAISEYKKKWERQHLFGFRKKIAAGSSGATTNDRYISGGIRDFLVANGNCIKDGGGAFTYDKLAREMVQPSRHSMRKRFLGVGGFDPIRLISQWSLDKHRADVTNKNRYGINIQQIFGGSWQIDFVASEAFMVESGGLYANSVMILDLDLISEVIMRKLPDTIHREITGPAKNGSHTRTDQITGTKTLEMKNALAHLWIQNITS